MRKMVAAGDLAMTRNNEEGGAYYRPYAQTPGLPPMDAWRGRISGSTTDLPEYKQNRPRTGLELEDEAELREAVMVCIARSVGLLQPNVDDQGGLRSFAPSMSASMVSTPNSPMFPPHGASMSQASHSVGGRRAPFGNVLDMMNAASHNDSLLEGMLREAVLKSNDREDDASSISMSQSHHDSASIMAGAGDRGVLRELEGKVQVMHYAKGTQLVGEGEKCPGLYYVIDGFLEVCPFSIQSRSGCS
jgi:lysophospholipid hydrolase